MRTDPLDGARVVVTGGAGFVGSHVVDRLVERGAEVVVFDNLRTGRRRNLAHHLDGDGPVELRVHDVTEHIEVEGAVDHVLHLASPASPVDYLQLPIQTLKVGSLGTHNALGLSLAKEARFLLTSTSEVYGDPEVHPQPEDYWGHVNPIGPRGVYDEAKRFAEALTLAYHRTHGVDTRIARIFNTYGPRMDPGDGRVVSNFIVQALQGLPLTVYGDGKQTRSFCYVSDLVDGLIRLMSHEDEHGPVNLGNDGEYTMLELAELITEATGSAAELVFKELPADDPTRRRPDLTLARDRLAYEPQVPLADGLAQTVAHFRTIVDVG